MKNHFSIVNVVLAVAVIGLYVLHFCNIGGKTAASSASSSSDETVVTNGSMVYIQIDSLVQGFDMFHDLRAELEKKADGIKKDLENKGQAFEFKAKDFQEKVQKGLITRAQAEQQQGQLQQEQVNLQQYAQKMQSQMAEEEAVMFRRIYDAIQTFLKDYNKEHNYSLILSTSGSSNVVLQGSPALDITKDVMNGMNAGYTKK